MVRSPSACFGGNLHAPGFRSFRRVALRLFHFWILRRLKHGCRAFHEPRAPYVALHINIVQCLSDRRGVPIPLAISVFCNQSSWNVIFVHMWYFSMCLNCMVIFEIIYVNSTVILQNYFLVFKVTSILCWWKYKYIIKSFFNSASKLNLSHSLWVYFDQFIVYDQNIFEVLRTLIVVHTLWSTMFVFCTFGGSRILSKIRILWESRSRARCPKT